MEKPWASQSVYRYETGDKKGPGAIRGPGSLVGHSGGAAPRASRLSILNTPRRNGSMDLPTVN
jgi:hypothetical protein